MTYYKRLTCRACNNKTLQHFLTLGPTSLANAFLKTKVEFSEEKSYPLDVYFCETCSLVQLLDVVAPEILFRNYIYVTGTSDTIATHNKGYAQKVVDLQNLKSEDLVIEVASNDGSLLSCFKPYKVRTLGIEPATNIAQQARAAGIETVNEFFNCKTAQQVSAQYGKAKAVIGNNVLAHVDDTQDFLKGAKMLLAEDGLVIIEVPYLKEFLDRLEYDTVYHEHLCYFSVTTLLRLCDAVGLSLIQVDNVPVHGGSIRMYAGLPQTYGTHSESVLKIKAQEEAEGLTSFSRYQNFSDAVQANRQDILTLLTTLKKEGKTLAGYGAPAKGNTFLNYCGIDTELVPYTVDKSPMKVGLYTPGMHIPVLPVETLLERQPDYVLILAWNFAEEIISQQQTYRERGGKFIIPIPEPKVI